MSVESYGTYVLESDARRLRVEAEHILAHNPEQRNTWWLPFDREPSNIIEDYVVKSAMQHGVHGSYLGAEWWIREHTESSSSWYFHVDSDVARWRQEQVYYSAPFSTVLYLCDSGQPTVVVDKYADWEKTDNQYIVGENHWSMWSAPKMGKQINWSLPYFHGVVGNYGKLAEGETRITLMFNVWKTKPYAPSCIDYNLPYEIKKGCVTLTPIKDTDIEWKHPHGHIELNLEGVPFNLQYHGFCQHKKSWTVTQHPPQMLEVFGLERSPTQ